MTQARRIIDIVGPEKARDFLRDVIHLVRHPAGRDKKTDPPRLRRADAPGNPFVSLLPRDAAEPRVAMLAQHRIRQAPEFTKTRVVDGLNSRTLLQLLP